MKKKTDLTVELEFNEDNIIKGEVFKKEREKIGYSLRDLSEKTGISTATLNRYESVDDVSKIPMDKLKSLSNALNIPISYLTDSESVSYDSILEAALAKTIKEYEGSTIDNNIADKFITNITRKLLNDEKYQSMLSFVPLKQNKIKQISNSLISINDKGFEIISSIIELMIENDNYLEPSLIKLTKNLEKDIDEVFDSLNTVLNKNSHSDEE